MKQNYSDDFVIVRHYVWYNFVAANCPIRREALDVQDVVALIDDIGKDWRDKSKRGYAEVPKLSDPVYDLRILVERVAALNRAGALEAAALTATLEKEAKTLAKKYGFHDYWSEP